MSYDLFPGTIGPDTGVVLRPAETREIILAFGEEYIVYEDENAEGKPYIGFRITRHNTQTELFVIEVADRHPQDGETIEKITAKFHEWVMIRGHKHGEAMSVAIMIKPFFKTLHLQYQDGTAWAQECETKVS